MTSPLLTQHVLATHPTFQARVRMAFSHVARDVCAEDPTTAGHDLRYALARTAVNPSDLTSPGYASAIATNPAVAAAAQTAYDGTPDSTDSGVSDELIVQAVRQVWNVLCGWVPGSNGQAEGP
ncbi:hypothetical protein ACQEVS_09755 [Streptomyces sp. CA-181903]|uniref:hypothetical protein n=1 Tax=Streptomyces sp. CA-181903 TaxID=3240055 RepID=UPI003D8E3891